MRVRNVATVYAKRTIPCRVAVRTRLTYRRRHVLDRIVMRTGTAQDRTVPFVSVKIAVKTALVSGLIVKVVRGLIADRTENVLEKTVLKTRLSAPVRHLAENVKNIRMEPMGVRTGAKT